MLISKIFNSFMKKSFSFCAFLLSFVPLLAQQTKDSIGVQQLGQVVLVGKDPISEKFSAEKMVPIEIYTNPAASADPLKAITTLSASTNTKESANPSLRGANPDRSRVYLNGAPVLNPVRFSQENGLGNFSLFNTEMIQKQYVYASNPPLTLGNSSAGAVQIETHQKLPQQGVQLSVTLSNLGAMWSQKLSEKSFLQLYGNYQFSPLFLQLNQKSLQHIHHFSTWDMGANFRRNLSAKTSLNSFHYFINEEYDVRSHSLNFSGDARAKKKRFFSVNNLDYYLGKTRIRVVLMGDYSRSGFRFGSIRSHTDSFQFFNTIGVKTKVSQNFSLQYGADFSFFSDDYQETFPLYFYALSPQSPTAQNAERKTFHYAEPYVYARYDFQENWGASLAVRKNIFPDAVSAPFTSYQIASNYHFNPQNKLIFSAGKYHSYATPNYYQRERTLLASEQIALDYAFQRKDFQLSTALYYKKDTGDFSLNDYEKYDKIETFGAELALNLPLSSAFSLNVANTSLWQRQFIQSQKRNTALNLPYFVKAQLRYQHPSLLSCALLFTTRPGNHYTAVQGADFFSQANDFRPHFGEPFSETFPAYQRWDFSVNKLFALKNGLLIAFVSINNILNTENPSAIFYHKDYSKSFFDFYQKRTFFVGTQFRF